MSEDLTGLGDNDISEINQKSRDELRERNPDKGSTPQIPLESLMRHDLTIWPRKRLLNSMSSNLVTPA
jgi:hypothetical protein